MNRTKSLLAVPYFPLSPLSLFFPRTHLRVSLHYISATPNAFAINPCK
jgi:hypothetical protein